MPGNESDAGRKHFDLIEKAKDLAFEEYNTGIAAGGLSGDKVQEILKNRDASYDTYNKAAKAYLETSNADVTQAYESAKSANKIIKDAIGANDDFLERIGKMTNAVDAVRDLFGKAFSGWKEPDGESE